MGAHAGVMGNKMGIRTVPQRATLNGKEYPNQRSGSTRRERAWHAPSHSRERNNPGNSHCYARDEEKGIRVVFKVTLQLRRRERVR